MCRILINITLGYKVCRNSYSTLLHYDNDPTEKWRIKQKKSSIDMGLWLAQCKATPIQEMESLIDSKIAKLFSGLQDFDQKLFSKYGADLAAGIFILKIGGAVKFKGQTSWNISRKYGRLDGSPEAPHKNLEKSHNFDERGEKDVEEKGEKHQFPNIEEKNSKVIIKILDNKESNRAPRESDLIINILLSRYGALDPNHSHTFFPPECNFFTTDNDVAKNKPEITKRIHLVECIDLSSTRIMYRGLDNLQGLDQLQALSFNHCPYFDDYCLAKLPVLINPDIMRYLNISNCPKITERGLATLHNFLPGLNFLVAKDLEGVPTHDRPLIRSLLKNVLPKCQTVF